jgi:hypothetical protein
VEPVRVKLYGLFSMTRRRYVRQLVLTVVCATVVIGCWWWMWPTYRQMFLEPREGDNRHLDRYVAVMDALPYILAGAVALQLIEAFFVFRLFRAREAQQAAMPPAAPAPTPPGA